MQNLKDSLAGLWSPRFVKPYKKTGLEDDDWVSTDAGERLRSALFPVLAKTFYYWNQRSLITAIPMPRLLRNLAAVSTPDELDRMRIVLRWVSLFPKHPAYPTAQRILAKIPRRESFVGMLEKLVFDDAKVGLRELHDFKLIDPERAATLLESPPQGMNDDRPEAFVDFVRLFPKWTATDELFRSSFAKGGYEKIGPEDWKRLPGHYRYQIKASREQQRRFLKRETTALFPLEEFEEFKYEVSRYKPGRLRRVIHELRENRRPRELAHCLSLLLDADKLDSKDTSYTKDRFLTDWKALSRFQRGMLVKYLDRAPWLQFANSFDIEQKSIPRGLLKALKSGRIEVVRSAVLKNPPVFARTAITSKVGDRLLTEAFRNAELGAALDPYLSRTNRNHCLELARAAAKTPHELTVFEASAISSLGRRRFISNLARLWPRFSADRDGETSPFDELYHTYELPKRSGGKRLITAPNESLKFVQRRLFEHGFNRVPLAEPAHGFRAGRSIKTNAEPHVGQPIVINVDIRRFFDSTRRDLIVRATRQLANRKLSPRTTQFLADLCSYGGALPTGAPTSPAIANLILKDVDRALEKACKRHGVTYTRYADDLTFSGPEETKRILPFVEQVLNELGYEIDRRKTQIYRPGRRQMVTGVVVNKRANLPRRIRRRLRAAVHQRSQGSTAHWHGHPIGDDVLAGHLAHLRMFAPTEAEKLLRTLRARHQSNAEQP